MSIALLKKKKNYTALLLWCIALLSVSDAGAQRNVFQFNEPPDLLQASPLMYVYAIPPDSVYAIAYIQAPLSPFTPWLRQPAYIIPKGRLDSLLALPATPAGYYLTVDAAQAYIRFGIRQKQSFRVYITDLEEIKLLTIRDSVARELRSVSVQLGDRQVPYDTGMKGFVIKGFSDGGIVTIRRGSDVSFLRCSVTRNNDYEQPHRRNEATESAQRDRKYNGYLVTNKPVYLPHDTVKWKAYLENPFDKNRLVREELRISFAGQYYAPKTYNIAAAQKPEEPGVYFGEFVLGDSVTTDRIYNLDLYGAGSGLHIQQLFKTEDYLLDDTHLRVTGEGRDLYQPGDSVNLYAYAYNSNNLPVLDGQHTITVLPVDYTTTPASQTFIPDTLYSSIVPVDPDGETNIGFSTKAFPGVMRSFRCVVSLVNSNNEHADTSFMVNITPDDRYIKIVEEGNMLHAMLISHKKPVSGKGSMISMSNGRQNVEIPITFPYDYRIGEEDQYISFTQRDDTGKVLSSINHVIGEAQLSSVENFHGDTALLELYNPKRVYFRYSIYTGDDFTGYGFTDRDTVIKVYSPKGRTVTITGTYTWKGAARQQRFEVIKLDRELNIDLRKKDLVYPGQRDTISIQLSNKDGNAIPRTNVTVLAFNSRFKEDYTPSLPYGGSLWPGYTPRYYRSILPLSPGSQPQQYVTREWLRRCGADTVFFYKNLYLLPDGVAWVIYTIPQSIQPQVGLYLKKGPLYYQLQIIYIDGRPAYIGHANSTDPEGFMVPEGTHSLSFRMQDAEYGINDFSVCAGMKTDLYLNLDSVGAFGVWSNTMNGERRTWACDNHLRTLVSKMPQPDTLSYYEKDALAASLLMYRPEMYTGGYMNRNTNYRTSQFFQSALQLTGQYGVAENYDGNGDRVMLIGPVNFGDSMGFYQQQNTKLRFLPERGYIFTFRPQMMRLEKRSVYDYLHYRLEDNSAWPSGNFVAPNPDTLDSLQVIPLLKQVPPQQPDKAPYHYSPAQPDYRVTYSLRDIVPGIPDTAVPAAIRLSVRSDSGVRYVVYHKAGSAGDVVILSNSYHYTSPIKVAAGAWQVTLIWQNRHYSQYNSVKLRANGTTIFPVSYRGERGIFNFAKSPKWLAPYVDVTIPYDERMQQHYSSKEAWKPGSATKASNGVSSIRGMLKDERGNPVVNGNVAILEGSIVKGRDLTDLDGLYNVRPLSPGRYDVRFSYLGRELTITGVVLPASRIVTVNGTISTMNEALRGGVQVSATRTYQAPLIDPESPGSRSIKSAESIERSPLRSISDAAQLSTQISTGGGLSIGGGRSTGTRYIIDGVQQIPGSLSFDVAPQSPGSSDEPADRQNLRGVMLNRGSDASRAFFSNFMANMAGASGLRKSFRDWAIWEPNLWTGSDGNATFTALYPDNLTSWKTYVLAMNRDGYAGRILRITRAFKPLSAQLSAPGFLRYGDTAEAIGKVANYTSEPFSLRSSFLQNGRLISGDTLMVHNTRVQTLQLAAPVENVIDTAQLPVTYSITTGGGYTDGEERTLPILPVGVTESKGDFVYLSSDTSISSAPDAAAGHFSGRTRITVDGSLLEVMLYEVESLKAYPHGCNEQLTTKLLAIYYEEAIKKLLGRKDFNNTEAKKKILDLLVRAQRRDGGFSWWGSADGDYRITNYIISTMQKVNGDGWLNLIIRRGLTFLNANLEAMSPDNQIVSMQTLAAGNYAANYKPLLDKLDSQRAYSLYNRAAIIKLRKDLWMPYRAALDTFMQERQESMHGIHWGGARYDWYRDDLATTLLAYSLIRGDSVYGGMANAISRYVFFRRQNKYYGSTASAGLVLSTLLPDLLAQQPLAVQKAPTYVRITGSVRDSVVVFPKTYAVREEHPRFGFEKRGISPVYISVVYDYFNTKPAARDSSFTVRSYFLNAKQDTITTLKAGGKITLRTTVRCRHEAEYIMIEVPIPAGCIQADKSSSHGYMEAARENFKDQTDIFCNSLSPGVDYTFDITLEARYKGSYSVSPARAGMMYYPEEYGNTEAKKVRIK